MKLTRRTVLRSTAGLASLAAFSRKLANPNPLDRPIGLQLYTVSAELDKDFHGGLKRIAAIGYKEVELAQTHSKSAKELRKAFKNTGLTCRSAYKFGRQTPEQFMDFANELGVKYVVTAFLPQASEMSLDYYKKSAETANMLGEAAKKRGLQYLCHNHNPDFKPLANTTGYDVLLASTDPELVKLELDCGWMSAAGQDPVSYLEKYSSRYRLLHIRSFHPGNPTFNLTGPGAPVATELGRGVPDYSRIFQAAKQAGIEQYYVEQEPPFKEMSAFDAIKVDYDYLHALQV